MRVVVALRLEPVLPKPIAIQLSEFKFPPKLDEPFEKPVRNSKFEA